MSLVTDSRWSITPIKARRAMPLFERHCEAEFEYLADHSPEALIDLIAIGELEPSLLTFACESVGSVGPEYLPKALQVLMPLLNHSRPHVREGAVYGIARIALVAPKARALLEGVANDVRQHEGVRVAARSVLGLE